MILLLSGTLYITYILLFDSCRGETHRFYDIYFIQNSRSKAFAYPFNQPPFRTKYLKTYVVYNVSPAMRKEGWDEFCTWEMAIFDSPSSAATDRNKLWEIKLSESLCCVPPGNSISIWHRSVIWKRYSLSTVLFLFLWFLLFSFYFGTGVEDNGRILNYVGFNCMLMIYLTMK